MSRVAIRQQKRSPPLHADIKKLILAVHVCLCNHLSFSRFLILLVHYELGLPVDLLLLSPLYIPPFFVYSRV